jgi:hypothetical protein
VIFFEGARITLEAHIAEYPEQYHADLQKRPGRSATAGTRIA